MGGSTSQVENNIKSVWTHLQANFCHSSLGSKVLVERLPGIKYYAGEWIDMESIGCSFTMIEGNMEKYIEADLNGADLMAFVGTAGVGWGEWGGKAFIGSICNNIGNLSKGIDNKTIRS